MLTAKAYRAAGQADSAMHAMVLLQVYQAKVLKELHKGSYYPGFMQELYTVMDLTLCATKVTARSLGQAMSTMVVQELHPWLNLADMRETDKYKILDYPISQAGLFGNKVENYVQQFSAAQKHMQMIRHILPRRARCCHPPSVFHLHSHTASASTLAPVWSWLPKAVQPVPARPIKR